MWKRNQQIKRFVQFFSVECFTFIFGHLYLEFTIIFLPSSILMLHITLQQRRESYQKELVLSSDQALLKKKSPPERYVYTRRSSLSKRKQCSPHVAEGPGG